MSKPQTYGYGRVSATDQKLEVQTDKLNAAGCDRLFMEKKSAKTTQGRDQLALVLDLVREGDTLVVTRLDRLARSCSDLLAILQRLESKGVTFRCLDQPIDTGGPMGRFMVTIMGAVAEFELAIRRERQLDGIAKAKEAGVYKGRPAKIAPAEIRALTAEGLGATDVAKRLGISRASVYRALGETGSKQESSL